MSLAATAILGFLLGSVPFAYLFVRIRVGEDVRDHGSGNPGATNASRILGTGWGGLVLLLDGVKGAAAVLVGGVLAGIPGTAVAAAASVAGHCFTPWLRGRGGKGVATTMGAFLVATPVPAGVAVVVLASVAAATRYVSVGSLVAAPVLAVAAWLWGEPGVTVAAAGGVAVLIWIRHHANVGRLLRGTEKKWGSD